MSSTLRAVCALVIACAFAGLAHSQSMNVVTIAGSPFGGGHVDAPGTSAEFSFPHAVAFDRDGNLFVADRGNHVIRKIDASGNVTTFAGMPGVAGSADGTGSAARFYHPAGLAVDIATNVLYVADSWNHTIRAVTPEGVVTTVAGSAGRTGSDNGEGSAARFAYPQGLAVDASGFIWVADTSNHKIRRIVGRTVTTFTGYVFSGFDDGDPSEAKFNYPFDVAVDRDGNLYVADADNHAIRKITREGITTTIAGNPYEPGQVDGPLANARFDDPWAIEVAANGDIYVIDSDNHAVRRISGGMVTTVAGATDDRSGMRDGTGTNARFTYPTGLAFDSAGRLFVADRANFAIRRITIPGFEVTTFAGSKPVSGLSDGQGTNARFFYPESAVSDSAGNLYVVDGHSIRKIAPDGVVTTLAGTSAEIGSADGPGSVARFRAPSGITIDSTGVLWVADTGNHTIRKVTPEGVVTTVAGVAGVSGKADGIGDQARFNDPWGLAFDSAGQLYIADSSNHLIRVMRPNGVVVAFAGTGNAGSSNSSVATAASFRFPLDVAIDGAGNIYVADWGNHTIRKISPAGVTTLAGNPGVADSTNGSGVVARFNGPRGIVVDGSGVLYVADTNNHAIRRITAAGEVSTVAGQAGSPGNVDGAGSAARFFWPHGVALDSTGAVIVIDTWNHVVKRASFAPPAVVSFTATPQIIKSGDRVTLAWNVTGATSVSIDNGVGNVGANGSVSIPVTARTTFILTATGPGGTSTARVTVYIGGGKRRSSRH